MTSLRIAQFAFEMKSDRNRSIKLSGREHLVSCLLDDSLINTDVAMAICMRGGWAARRHAPPIFTCNFFGCGYWCVIGAQVVDIQEKDQPLVG
jgi:hypothetical protein